MTISFLRADKAYPDEICGMCKGSLTEDVFEHAVHRFHGRCIAEWVKIEPTCPSCKKTVDTTSLLGENILQKQDELNQTRERLGVIENGSLLGAIVCGIAPYISERCGEHVVVLYWTAYCLVGVAVMIPLYLHMRR